jgi:hypothetical protein
LKLLYFNKKSQGKLICNHAISKAIKIPYLSFKNKITGAARPRRAEVLKLEGAVWLVS